MQFCDSMLQASIIARPTRELFIPTRIDQLRCNPLTLYGFEDGTPIADCDLALKVDVTSGISVTPGVEIKGVTVGAAPRRDHCECVALDEMVISAINALIVC